MEKCIILTPDIRKHPQTSLESLKRADWGLAMITRGSYVHKTMVRFLGASRKSIGFFCVCKILKILMVSDKTIHKAFRIHTTLPKQTNALGISPPPPPPHQYWPNFTFALTGIYGTCSPTPNANPELFKALTDTCDCTICSSLKPPQPTKEVSVQSHQIHADLHSNEAHGEKKKKITRKINKICLWSTETAAYMRCFFYSLQQ